MSTLPIAKVISMVFCPARLNQGEEGDKDHCAVVAETVPRMIAGKKLAWLFFLDQQIADLIREDYKMTVPSPLWITEAAAQQMRPVDGDLTLFKAMGMGVSDLAVGIEIYERAMRQGKSRSFAHPQCVTPKI